MAQYALPVVFDFSRFSTSLFLVLFISESFVKQPQTPQFSTSTVANHTAVSVVFMTEILASFVYTGCFKNTLNRKIFLVSNDGDKAHFFLFFSYTLSFCKYLPDWGTYGVKGGIEAGR